MSISPAVPDETGETQELTPEIRAGMLSLFQSLMKEEQVSRRSEVRNAWKQRAFKNGIQYLWYDSTSYTFLTPEASGQALSSYMDVYNIYTPHWRSFVSLLSQNPPGINFPPDDLQKPNDVTAGSYAEKIRHRVDKLVHMKDRQMEAAGLFCTDGRTIAWTRLDPKGNLKVTMHGVLESKVPIYARKMEKWSYCVLSEEIDLYQAKEDWPDYADEIEADTGGTADATYERYARLNVIANRKGALGFGDAFKSITTEHNAWVRPSRYRKADEETREYLKTAFPDGMRMVVCGGVVVDAQPEVMESALRAEWPAPGQGQNRPSMLHDLVPIQEAFNDILNMIREHGDYSIPARWVSDKVDSEAIAEQISAPGVTHQITVPQGASIADLVFVEPTATLPAELVANADRLLQLAEFTTGDLPSLYGQGTPDQETASGQKMLSDQAKGQLSSAWAGIQWLFAGIYEIAVRLVAQTSDSSLAVPGDTGAESFNPQAILDGNWGCYPDTDSSFPETTADKRASLQLVLGQLSQIDPTLALNPDNQKLIAQFSGLGDDLVILAANSRDKQLREIEQLLQEPPIPDESQMPQYMQAAEQAMAQGQQPPPPPMQSSVPVDEEWDYHQFELDKLQEWLSSKACLEAQRQGNLQGIQNVKLHGQAHKAALAKQAQKQIQQTPMTISGAFKDLDPATKVQVLERDGYQPDAGAFETDAVQTQQDKAATTQHKAAQAQHQSVLAAKEAVAPVKSPTPPQPTNGVKQ